MGLPGTDAREKRVQADTVVPVGKIRCGTAHGKVEPEMQGITAAKGRTENTEEQSQNKKFL
jgi:hypothetical protein